MCPLVVTSNATDTFELHPYQKSLEKIAHSRFFKVS